MQNLQEGSSDGQAQVTEAALSPKRRSILSEIAQKAERQQQFSCSEW